MRPRTIIALGVGVGVTIALTGAIGDQVALAHGQNPAAVGFGSSHLLFVVSLPWSAGVVAAMWTVLSLLHADGPAALRPFFYAMPIVSGLAWSALVAIVVDWRRVRRQASRPAV